MTGRPVKLTIYLPDDLAAEVKAELGDTNVSAICQAALRDELGRQKGRAAVAAKGFERVEVYDVTRAHGVAFQGRSIARSYMADQEAWLTAKGAIAVYDADPGELVVFDDFAELAARSERVTHRRGSRGEPSRMLAGQSLRPDRPC